MMTPAPVASAADAASYYSSKDNYYFLDDMPTQWLGEGARSWVLKDPLTLIRSPQSCTANSPTVQSWGKRCRAAMSIVRDTILPFPPPRVSQC
jgi:hypothetical protein